MNIWTFELSLNEHDINNQRFLGGNGGKLGEGHFRQKKSNTGQKMNGLFQECQTVPGAQDPDIPGDKYLIIG